MSSADKVEKFLDVECALGEGINISSDGSTIWWVDILGGLIHSKSKRRTSVSTIPGVREPSCVLECTNDSAMVAARDGIYEISQKSRSARIIHPLPDLGMRSNDATKSPDGSYWVSRMDRKEEKQIGTIERVSLGSRGSEVLIRQLGIPNTLIIDQVRNQFIYGDSKKGILFLQDLSPSFDLIGSPKIFFQTKYAPGVPDGSALDNHGNIWNCRWGGSCIAKISPNGQLLDLIDLPTLYPTSCKFLSEKILIVTTAQGNSPKDYHPFAGYLLKVTLK